MQQFILVLCALCTTVLFCGCSILPEPAYSEPMRYDLGSAYEKVPVPANVELGLFADQCGNGTRMVTRSVDGLKISYDEYNRFSAVPALLVKRGLAVCLVPEKGAALQKVLLSGDLLRFEYLSRGKKVRMVIDYELKCGGKVRKIRQDLEEKVTGPGAAAAAGFEKCIIRSARLLAGEIRSFVKECAKERK